MENITIIMDETPERFRHYADQIIPDFIELFREYTKITTPLMKQRKEIIEQNKHIIRTADNWNDFDDYYAILNKIDDECRKRKAELLAGHITDNIYVTNSDKYPSEFDYFNSTFKLRFIMKSEKKITIDTIPYPISDRYGYLRHRFILRPDPDNGKWLIDWFGFSYEEEGYLRKWDL